MHVTYKTHQNKKMGKEYRLKLTLSWTLMLVLFMIELNPFNQGLYFNVSRT